MTWIFPLCAPSSTCTASIAEYGLIRSIYVRSIHTEYSVWLPRPTPDTRGIVVPMVRAANSPKPDLRSGHRLSQVAASYL